MPDERRSTQFNTLAELRVEDEHNRPARFWVDYLAPGTDALRSYSNACRRHGYDSIRVVNPDGETLFHTSRLEAAE